MDTVEATKLVMSRIQKLDPENASKIMGYILIQDQGDNEMIRLAFGPENLLLSVIKQAKSFLDITSNTSSALRNTPQITIPTNGFSFSDHRGSPRPASYAAVVNGGGSPSFYPNDEFDYSDSVLSPGGRSEYSDHVGQHHLHRRSCSVNDMFGGGGDDVAGGWRPCMYYSRGFCKNGTECRFVHGNGGFVDELGFGSCFSPTGNNNNKVDYFEDLVRIKAIQQQQQQQRFAAMAAEGVGVPHFPFNRSAAAALMMGDEFHKFGRCRPDRNEFGPMGFLNANSSSRQIYLTFPADSTFKEEDVSNYFSMFGPVQDVRIPYQQKRMFGFVTFMLPETVKAILAKGNPHFVCDSRVLVKPYKEKGKLPDKKHLQQIERGDFSSCLSPTALESAEPFDHIPFGARMFNHEMMIRGKLEEQELQQAIELQDRRLMNLQLSDVKNHHFQRSLSVSSPTQINQNLVFSFDDNNSEELVSKSCDESDPNVETTKNDESLLENALPDNLFASPTRSATTDNRTNINISNDVSEGDFGAANPLRVTSKCQAIEM
ncbi:zinc finger CCCH domain-containing protein 46-like isoform X2 [Bidens hawaiensis]|uniref:zinc finger CCCH domain-containing protein 46-like isoform X2 n=1 Tax=Bidens hawaiensis TaxID=980011 RepID=UPI004049D8DE